MNKLKKLEKKYKELGQEIERLKCPKLELGDNLKVTHYRNGDPIPLAISNEQWKEFGEKEIGAYSITKDGNYLYNWYAVNDARNITPEGWHIPTDEEFNGLKKQLAQYATFAGRRSSGGNYSYASYAGYFWSSNEYDEDTSWRQLLYRDYSEVNRISSSKKGGFAVCCVKEK
tara:strand:+ start:498 stop:1013 length:516 start_codon:yes stop_codon:yes gene_type:complete